MTPKQQTAINNVFKRVKTVDGIKTIQGDVKLYNLGLTELPDLSDVVINGDFYCNHNNLISLKGCPTTINGGLCCSYNQLTSLQYGPNTINGGFNCDFNELVSLQYSPKTIKGNFYGSRNPWPPYLNIPDKATPQEYINLIQVDKINEAKTQEYREYLKVNKISSMSIIAQKAINDVLKLIKTVDGVKTIDGDVNLYGLELKELPDLSDVVINGNFQCNHNKLTSLKGAPNIINGAFNCSGNELVSLQYAPTTITGYFHGSRNPWAPYLNIQDGIRLHEYANLLQEDKANKAKAQDYQEYIKASKVPISSIIAHGVIDRILKRIVVINGVKTITGDVDLSLLDLTELPDLSDVVINGNFGCGNNNLTSLKGCPTTVNGIFDCHNNKLTSLEGCPKIIKKEFCCYDNQLTSLKYVPEIVYSSFDCNSNQLTNLQHAPIDIGGTFYGGNNPWSEEVNILDNLEPTEYICLIQKLKRQTHLKSNPVPITSVDMDM